MKHLPNVLTIGRIAIVPVFLVLLFTGTLVGQLVATVLFITAAISDYWDGRLARQYGTDSRLGRFLDPLADKVLVLGAFFAFLFLPPDGEGNQLAASWWGWGVGLIALRDLAVTALRAWSERQGRSIQTRYAAKLKTTVQLTFLIAVLVFLTASKLTPLSGWLGDLGALAAVALYGPATSVLLLVTVVLTLWTGVLYFTSRQPAAVL